MHVISCADDCKFLLQRSYKCVSCFSSHGNDKVFSCKGIELCVNYFIARGHKQITAFVPEWRKYRNQQGNSQVIDIEILESLKGKGYLVFTPCRRLPGRWIASHDDRWGLNICNWDELFLAWSSDPLLFFRAVNLVQSPVFQVWCLHLQIVTVHINQM